MKRVEPTLFHERWWLDLATDGLWRPIEYIESGKLVAWIPYCPERVLWFRRSRMPTLTHFLGPVLSIDSTNAGNRAQSAIYVVRQLIGKLPSTHCFRQTTYRGVEGVLGFQIEGFTTTAQFTFVIDDSSPQNVWHSMRDKVRNTIRNAQKSTTIVEDLPTAAFIDFYRRNMTERRLPVPAELSTAGRMVEAARSKGRGEIYAALDGRGRLQAAIFCGWDDRTAYYLMSTRAAKSENGAIAMLLWHAIQAAIIRGRSFDFDGIAFAGSAPFLASFGAKCEPRFLVSKLTPTYGATRNLAHIVYQRQGSLFDEI